MRTISLMDIKEELNKLYEKCDQLDKYNISSKQFREEIILIDAQCDNLCDDSNLSIGPVKYKGDYKTLYQKYVDLDSRINKYIKALHIFDSIKKVNKDLKKDELYPLQQELYNDLANYYHSKLSLKEFDDLYPSLYQFIKLEYKYTGSSLILKFLRVYNIDTSKIDDLYYNELANLLNPLPINYIFNKAAMNDFIEYDKYLLYLSIKENGYLDSIFKELEPLKQENNELLRKIKELDESIKTQKKINRKNKIRKLKLFKNFWPIAIYLSGIITLNSIYSKPINNKFSSYKTTTETYDSIEGTYTTTSYDKLSVGDSEVTIYYPTKLNGTRIIKTYNFNDENFDIDDIDTSDFEDMEFSKSIYKYDSNLNQKSNDEFVHATKVTEVDYNDKIVNKLKVFLFHLLLSAPFMICDMIISLNLLSNNYYSTYIYEEKNVTLLTLLMTLKDALEYFEYEIKNINKIHPKRSTKEDKKEITELEKQKKKLLERYNYIYDKYLYIESLLHERGYQRKLK